MKRRSIIKIGIVLTFLGLLLSFLSIMSLTTVERCTVLNSITEKDGKKILRVQRKNGTPLEARLFRNDQHDYRTGDRVLVDFPMGPSYVLVGYPKVMHYILDYPIILTTGIILLIVGIIKRSNHASEVTARNLAEPQG